MNNTITIQATVAAPVGTVWELYNNPEHIKNWNNASPDWHTPSAENSLEVGGTFTYRMEARDGSVGFDFGGTYSEVEEHNHIAYTMDDGRNVRVSFDGDDVETTIVTEFEPEKENDIEMQRNGWQSILDNFKKYVEGQTE